MGIDIDRRQVVAVTGAASGIGWAVCREYARRGSAVALIDQDGQGLRKCAEALRREGAEAITLTCDVSRQDACEEALAAVEERLGDVDILVNNAGITQRSAFAVTRAEVFRRVMDVNFFGALYCTRAALGGVIRRRGSIVVIESMAGVTPLLGRSAYCASKHALQGLFTTLRAELRSTGVHVMIVCPGFVETNLQTRALGGDGRVTDRPQSIVGRPCSAQRVARAVVRGVVRRKALVIVPAAYRFAFWIYRLAPRLYERLMARRFESELGCGRPEENSGSDLKTQA